MNTRLLKLFRRPTPLEMAAKELADAELSLLQAHSGVEYAQSLVNYRTAQITRLRSFVAASATSI